MNMTDPDAISVFILYNETLVCVQYFWSITYDQIETLLSQRGSPISNQDNLVILQNHVVPYNYMHVRNMRIWCDAGSGMMWSCILCSILGERWRIGFLFRFVTSYQMVHYVIVFWTIIIWQRQPVISRDAKTVAKWPVCVDVALSTISSFLHSDTDACK
jgi:hypothetical protein